MESFELQVDLRINYFHFIFSLPFPVDSFARPLWESPVVDGHEDDLSGHFPIQPFIPRPGNHPDPQLAQPCLPHPCLNTPKIRICMITIYVPPPKKKRIEKNQRAPNLKHETQFSNQNTQTETHTHMLNCQHASVQYFLWAYTCTPTPTCTFSLTKTHKCTHSRRRRFKSGRKTPPSVRRLYKRLPLRETTGPDRRLQYSLSVRRHLGLVTPAPSSVFQLDVKIVLVIVSFSGENVCMDTQEQARKEAWRKNLIQCAVV